KWVRNTRGGLTVCQGTGYCPPRGGGMHGQKSAEGIVGGGEGGEPMSTHRRRPEQRTPRVGRMISMRIDEAEALGTGAWNEVGGRKLSEGVRGAEMRTATCGQTKSEDDVLM